MSPVVMDVNQVQRTSRRARAQATRGRMLESARRLFVGRGYPATTMDDIAAEAGVAVQTVYYTFRTKSLLLREVVELAGAGQPDEPPVNERAWMQDVLTQASGDRALALAVEHGADIYARVAPLWPALYAAAVTDPDVETYFRTVASNRRAGMGRLVAHLEAIGYLRPGLSTDQATDVVFALFSHETFLALTRDAAWPVPAYKAFLFSILRSQLTDGPPSTAEATRGLSYRPAVVSRATE